MKKVKVLYFLLLFLLFPFVFASAQEEELKKLPTIVVRGEDRSYLEIIREKKINYMGLRGEKIKFEPPLVLPFTPPVREKLQPPVSFPSLAPSKVKLAFYPEEPGKIPPKSLTLPPPESYLGEEKLSFPFLKEEKKVPILKKTVQKRLIYPPIEEISIPKRTYTPSPVAYAAPEQKLRKKIPQKPEILPHMPPASPVPPTYIKEEKVSLSVERKKEVVLPKKTPGEKKVSLFAPSLRIPEKPLARPSSPQLTFKIQPPGAVAFMKKIPAEKVKEKTLPHLYPVVHLRKVETEKIPLLTEVSHEEKERKRLIKPPLTAPFISKSLFPEKMERSNYPYLLFSLSSDDNGGFGYRVDCAREKDKRYLLKIKRESSPNFLTFKEEKLFREEDTIEGNISWGEVKENETAINLGGKLKNLELPDTRNRKDSFFHLNVNTHLSRQWRLTFQAGGGKREDSGENTEKYNDFTYGASVVLQPQEAEFSIEGGARWENLKRTLPTEKSLGKYEALLKINYLPPLTLGKNTFLENLSLGIKGIKEENAQLVGGLRLHFYVKENFDIQLNFKKDFYLPFFEDLYIEKDYSKVNFDTLGVNLSNYTLQVNYSKAPSIDFSVSIFREEGTDIVWLLDESTPATPALIPQNLKIAREGVSFKGSWQPTPSIVIEPYCLWKNLKNRQDPDRKVPHEPESTIGCNLQINLLDKDNQRVVFTAQGTWRGKRYYTFSSSSVLDSSSTTSLTLTYIRKTWKAFLGVEKTDYVFSKDLAFPETRLKFGVEIKLF